MKKSYIEPTILVEDFCLNENIAACEKIATPEELEWMPNNLDFEEGCRNACSYLALEPWALLLRS